MWYKIAHFTMRYRIAILVVLALSTAFFGYYVTKVKMSYTFTNAIPTDNPKYQDYQNFVKTYGVDGNTVMVGLVTDHLFEPETFNEFVKLTQAYADMPSVTSVLSVDKAVMVQPDSVQKIGVAPIFPKPENGTYSKAVLDSMQNQFYQLPFYKGLIYNKETNAYLLALNLDKEVMKTPARKQLMEEIAAKGDAFGAANNIEIHYSGLPFIRTKTANLVQHEITIFLVLSFALTALIIYVFFRSFSAVIISMSIIGIGSVWAMGMLALFGYEVTTLTGCIPPLIVIIAIPNVVYILNSYHQEYVLVRDKRKALEMTIGKMGIITLFTNVTTAIGFGVFSFTNSQILKEFGIITGINSITLFVITLLFVPIILSYLAPPDMKHTNYLDSKYLTGILRRITRWVLNHSRWIYAGSIALVVVSILGIMRLNSVGYIVDDLPKGDKIVSDLKFFEDNFKGVMPLEIIINTNEKFGAVQSLELWEKVDSLNTLLTSRPEIGGGLNIVKAVKFARQGLKGNTEDNYSLPDYLEFNALKPYLISTLNKRNKGADESLKGGMFSSVLSQYVDSQAQSLRLSVNVADIGSVALPALISEIEPQAKAIFEGTGAELTFTGTSVTFIEGSKFIINSLGESLAWAFGMIIVCMIILFRKTAFVVIAMIANIVPIAITAGIMGWAGIPLKPSTVLVFSIALGITVDVTIRFMTTIQQNLKENDNLYEVVIKTIQETGLSIICTTAILVFGFGVFAVSSFDGTKALGYLSAITLFLAMIFNLTLQPALLILLAKREHKKSIQNS